MVLTLPQVAGMSSQAFAASRDFSSVLGQLMQAGSAPANEVLAWAQQEYWRQYYEGKEKDAKQGKKKDNRQAAQGDESSTSKN